MPNRQNLSFKAALDNAVALTDYRETERSEAYKPHSAHTLSPEELLIRVERIGLDDPCTAIALWKAYIGDQ